MYQVLARKYRPRNFNELVGQNHVSRALTSALERGRLHHAYLFTGTRGVGKTTIARILAKCLNCETGVTSTPCEVCPTCTAVNEGRFIDLIEIDAASRTKVEDTRELLDNVPYAPTQGRFKVYLIDEVHMLSTHSFNALLKTLEEPPEHVKFLFATTDPQKLPITIISRCLQFTLRPLAIDEITTHLTNILQQEEIQAETDAIWQIAESAQGSLRDALSLTDQAIAYGQGSIQHQDVKDMLGLIDRTIIFDLILAIHQNQQQHVSALLMQFRQQALDVSLVLDQFISTLHELALLQYLPELSLKYSAEINAKIMQLSKLIAPQDLQLYYQVACKGRADLQLAVTQEQGFEMCILRLLAFRPIQPHEMVVPAPAQSPITNTAHTSPSHAVHQSIPNESSHPSARVETDDVALAIESEAVTAAEQQSDDIEISSQIDTSDEVDSNPDQYPIESEFSEKTSSPSQDEYVVSAQQVITPVVDDSLSEPLPRDEELELTSFGQPMSATQDQTESVFDGEEVFFLQPEDEQPLQLDENQTDQEFDISASTGSASIQQEFSVDVKPNDLDSINSQSTSELGNSTTLMPQDILKLPEQQLEGDWDVDKWEYWFRQSDLSPAIQELAQRGVMTGTINGECQFTIPEQYEKILVQFQHTLESELKTRWPKTVLQVHYEDVTEQTPYAKQAERKQKAFQRANELLHQEDTVQSLMQMFDAELHNVQLKS